VELIYNRGPAEKLICNKMTKIEFTADIIYGIEKLTAFTK
jgi:hypothetical protein